MLTPEEREVIESAATRLINQQSTDSVRSPRSAQRLHELAAAELRRENAMSEFTQLLHDLTEQ